MSSRLLPRLVSVRKSVLKASNFQGTVPSEALTSLSAHVERCSDAVVEASFDRSEEGSTELKLSVSATVEQLCQRCLGVVRHDLEPQSLLTVVKHDEEAQQRLRDVEPLVLESDELDLYQLVEEELSLALPVIAVHGGDELKACEDAVVARLKADASFTSRHRVLALDSSAPDAERLSEPKVQKGETHRPFEGLAEILKLGGTSESG